MSHDNQEWRHKAETTPNYAWNLLNGTQLKIGRQSLEQKPQNSSAPVHQRALLSPQHSSPRHLVTRQQCMSNCVADTCHMSQHQLTCHPCACSSAKQSVTAATPARPGLWIQPTTRQPASAGARRMGPLSHLPPHACQIFGSAEVCPVLCTPDIPLCIHLFLSPSHPTDSGLRTDFNGSP